MGAKPQDTANRNSDFTYGISLRDRLANKGLRASSGNEHPRNNAFPSAPPVAASEEAIKTETTPTGRPRKQPRENKKADTHLLEAVRAERTAAEGALATAIEERQAAEKEYEAAQTERKAADEAAQKAEEHKLKAENILELAAAERKAAELLAKKTIADLSANERLARQIASDKAAAEKAAIIAARENERAQKRLKRALAFREEAKALRDQAATDRASIEEIAIQAAADRKQAAEDRTAAEKAVDIAARNRQAENNGSNTKVISALPDKAKEEICAPEALVPPNKAAVKFLNWDAQSVYCNKSFQDRLLRWVADERSSDCIQTHEDFRDVCAELRKQTSRKIDMPPRFLFEMALKKRQSRPKNGLGQPAKFETPAPK